MRLLHLISTLDPSHGGTSEAVVQLASALDRAGHTNAAATLDAPGAPWLDTLPFPTHALGPNRGSYQFAPRAPEWLRARDASGADDALIVHGLWQHHGFAAWRAWRRSPRFVFAHGMLDPWFKRAYPRKHLKKWLYWPWAEYWILRQARAVFFTCEEERRLARESFWLYRCREAVANLGIVEPPGDADEQRALFFEKFPDLRGRRILLFLGRLVVKKGCDLLLHAFARLASRPDDVTLVMAGPGEDSAFVADLRRGEATRENVRWVGMLSGAVKWGALRAAEAFILPSHQENFGLAVVEALACGTPVLLSDKVNIWREVSADGAGLVAADDFDGTLDLLRRWLALPEEARRAFRERARACYARRFQIDQAAAALARQLRELGVRV
ncbi:MAG: glycosyltransferase [Verrucomicrobia bacterium]|nr:glycosyltransferase [Verrucomicrobiota bacterium]